MDIYCSKICSCGEDVDNALASALKAVRFDKQTLSESQKNQVKQNLGIDGAGLDGEDGVGISSVTQTTTSNADGGTNVVTVTLTNGAKSTFQVKNGNKGSTPVKGTDYWTDSDKAEIVQEVSEEIGSGGGSGGSVFYITITGADGVYTADKTRAEVDAAFAAGRPVFCLFTGAENYFSVEGLIMPFICYMDGMALFSSYLTGINWIVVFGDTEMIMVMITESLTSDNLPETLPNPNALTFKGAASGTYDGSRPLEITIPAGSGEPGKDGFSPTITVTNTYTPTTQPDGTILSKINGFILKITDVNGTVSRQIFYGKDGADGYSPVKGVDYWTPEDREQIVQEVITALGTPVFGTVDEQNNIILTGELVEGTYTLKYEDTDGNVTTIGTLAHNGSAPTYTNLANPTSAEWLANKRLNSSGSAVDTGVYGNGGAVTNFIPCKNGDVIRVKGLNVTNYYSNNTGDVGRGFAYFYAEDKSTIIAKNIPADGNGWVYANNVWSYTVGTSLTAVSGSNSDIRYVRLTGIYYSGYTKDDVIITVNQEIT